MSAINGCSCREDSFILEYRSASFDSIWNARTERLIAISFCPVRVFQIEASSSNSLDCRNSPLPSAADARLSYFDATSEARSLARPPSLSRMNIQSGRKPSSIVMAKFSTTYPSFDVDGRFLAASVPPPMRHVTVYSGVLASNSRWRRLIVPKPAVTEEEPESHPSEAHAKAEGGMDILEGPQQAMVGVTPISAISP